MQEGHKVRIGVFDQIVSGGGVYNFTLRLLEGLSEVVSEEVYFHVMWPLFDSSGEFLKEMKLPHTTFERIGTSYRSMLFNSVAPFFLKNKMASEFGRLEKILANLANNQQLSNLRVYDGAGLRWLDQRMNSYDLLYLPYTYYTFPKNWKWVPLKPLVVTIHDLAHETTDAWGKRTQDIRDEIRKWINAASHIIFSSEYIKNESIRLYGFNEEKASTIYLAPLQKKKYDGTKKKEYPFGKGYVFTIGWAAKHKRLETILEGFARYKERYGTSIPLVIAGPNSDKLVVNKALGLEINKDIFLLGYVRDDQIAQLYSDASAVVTASVSEAGFNAMIYDAMNFEVPIICSTIPQFIERLGVNNEMALTFNPYDHESLSMAFKNHFDDPRAARERASRAKEYIDRRTWKDVARDYISILERVSEKKLTGR